MARTESAKKYGAVGAEVFCLFLRRWMDGTKKMRRGDSTDNTYRQCDAVHTVLDTELLKDWQIRLSYSFLQFRYYMEEINYFYAKQRFSGIVMLTFFLFKTYSSIFLFSYWKFSIKY